jgi:predicted permease
VSDFRLPPLNAGERVYRALLALYPPRFRHTFALDLLEAFRDQRRDSQRAGTPAAAFWLGIVQDVFVHASAEWATTVWRAARRDGTHTDREDSPMAAFRHALRLTELRFAARRLLHVRSFTVASVLVLSLGIGATTAVFSIVNGVLLRPLPYPRSDRLVALTHTIQVSGVQSVDQSDANVLFYQEHARAFDGIAATRLTDANLAAPSASGRPERVSAAQTSANLFDVLQVPPLLGRGFQSGEDRISASPVAILSYALWQSRYHGDRSIVGTRIVVDGVSRQIVGVMPQGFAYPSPSVRIFVPIRFDPPHASVSGFNYRGIGRLRDGVSVEEARADLERTLPRILDEFPSGIPPEMWKQAHVEPQVTSLRDSIVGSVSHMLWILLASVSLVLIIACANVANLFLVRGESRQLEFAVRGALGSGLAGMLAQSLSESVLLSITGGAVGVILAALGVHLAAGVGDALGLPRLDEVSTDGRTLLFALAASTFCAVFVSIIPVLRVRRVPIAMVLRGSGRGNTRQRHRARNALVIAQTALALLLVAASGLLARSFMRLEAVKPGFDADNVVIAKMTLPTSAYASTAARMQFFDAVLARLRATPGVEGATLGDWIPLSDDHNDSVISIEDHPMPANAVPDDHFTTSVDGQYFRTMRIPILSGRSFGRQDAARPTLEAVVSRAFARRYWKNESPLGKRIRSGISGPWYIVVGEAGDVHYDALDRPANDIVYFPMVTADADTAATQPYFSILARSGLPASAVESSIRDIVHSLDPALPTYGETSMTEIVRAASARAREMLVLLAIASALALVLGAVGLYGTLAYTVSLRQREIGVRIALGAQPSQVRLMIAGDGLVLAAIGVAIGVGAAIGVMRFLRSLLYDVSPTDPVILIGTCAVLLLVALAASWVPARRAASLDPTWALRAER